MITFEEEKLQAADTAFPNWPGIAHGTDAVTDRALMATLTSRVHCRTPMKRLDRQEPTMRESAKPDGRRTTVRPTRVPAPGEIATYRCMCGFTMDALSLAVDYAVAS